MLGAQLAEARTILSVSLRWLSHNVDVRAICYGFCHKCKIEAALAKPAPRADLIAAGMALAEIYCSTAGGKLEKLAAAEVAYRAAKEAANG